MSKLLFSRSIFFLSVLSLLLTGCAPKAVMPTGPDVTWHLVVLGDSSFWELAEAYGEQIRQDVGVQVEVHDYAIGSLSAGAVLDALQTGKSLSLKLRNLPGDLAQADVVVMLLNPVDSEVPGLPFAMDSCFLSIAKPSCDPRALEQWTADLESIWAEIFRLREG